MTSDEMPQEPMPPMKSPALPSGARSARRVLVFLFKLGLFVAVVAGLAAVIYFGWLNVYAQLILPAQNNTARIAVMESQEQANQKQLFALQTQLPALAAASQADQSAVLTAQAERMDTLEGSLEEQALTQAAERAALAPRMDTLESAIEEHSQALDAIQSTQTSLQADQASGQVELVQQISLLKSMELLSRARLFLYQSNFGLAKQDVQAARDVLAGVLAMPGPPPDEALIEVVQRLDQSLARLPDFPVAASGDLDIAWQILLGEQVQPTLILTTPTPTLVVSTLAAPAEQGTPTPTAVP